MERRGGFLKESSVQDTDTRRSECLRPCERSECRSVNLGMRQSAFLALWVCPPGPAQLQESYYIDCSVSAGAPRSCAIWPPCMDDLFHVKVYTLKCLPLGPD